MRLAAPFAAFDRAAGRLRAVLTDPAGGERNAILALAAYALLWTLYGTIAKGSQGLHYDMTEVIAWSRDLAWGYKHPPLAAFIVWLWFSVFPLAEWSYYLLAMLMPTVALWFAWRLSADYLDADKRVVGLALLMLIPFFNFHALKFNVNTVLMPMWAATTFWFLRSYATRGAWYAALAGAGAALCMLGKYWSVFLLVGLIVAALIGRRRGDYFRSAAPWIAVAAGFVVLSPHLAWLVRHDFAPFGYAVGIHGAKPFLVALKAALGYVAGSIGYVAIPLIVVLSTIRPRRAAFADMAWPREDARRLAAAAFWAPLLLPIFGALASGTEITSLWSMPAWTLLPVLLLSPPALTVAAADTRRILGLAIVVPLAVLLASPVIAINVQHSGPQPAAAHAQQLAAEIERVWHEMTPLPLRFVDGDPDIAYGVGAYAAERPRALPGMPAPGEAELKRGGVAILCFADDAGCRAAASARASGVAGSRTLETEIVRHYWRWPGQPRRYSIVILPPRS
ncbi:MAG: glycosyltransferase family 39 protein [Rhizobiales bacterium]|nr:glycosyltransferase family 39 protein [Hyphomicrobiales bacterium]